MNRDNAVEVLAMENNWKKILYARELVYSVQLTRLQDDLHNAGMRKHSVVIFMYRARLS